jgi:hypothetical protein
MKANVDPAFKALEVQESPQRREVAHLLEFWKKDMHREHAVSAVLSAKFGEKTGLKGQAFVDFIRNNPGFDVWFVNPFPQVQYLNFNIWEHGEDWHPGLCRRAQQLFDAVEPRVKVSEIPRSRPDTLLFCNYWAGTPRFWDRYMSKVEAYSAAALSLPEIFDSTRHYSETTFFPFFFERYFTTFLSVNPDVRACAWKHSRDDTLRQCNNDMEFLFVREWASMIDRWDASGAYSDDQREIFRSIAKFCALFASSRGK